MINFSGINVKGLAGILLRLPLRLVPRHMTLRIIQGELHGKKWIAGSSDHGCWLGSYEFDKQRFMAKTVKPGTVFFDIGANVGFYTLLASTLVGDEGKVFAFEPFPKCINLLKKHLKMNAVQNVTLFETAVSDRIGKASFQEGPSDSMGHLSETGTVAVEMVSLDDLFFKGVLPLPQYMKIDVEGAEFSVLQGAKHLLTAGSPTLFLATHGSEVHSQCLSFLRSLNYVCQPLDVAQHIEACQELVASKKVGE